MLASDVLSYAKTLSGEGVTGQRWTDDQLRSFIDRAQKMVVRDLKWPPSRYEFKTTSTVQEYQLQEVIKIEAVYLQGQPLIRTDKNILEGRFRNEYDQSGSGGGPGGLVVPNEAPVLVGNQYTPQWTSQTAAAYPVSSGVGFGYPVNTPWYAGQRPRYYCNGGNIGFVPAPLGALTVVCDVIAQPPTLQSNSDALVLPDIALDALAWKAVELMFFSDKDAGGSSDSRNYAMSQFQQSMRDLRSWKNGYDGDAARGPKPLTYRSFYVKGQNRNGVSD